MLGPHARLPPSLVWELAYGELVYSDAAVRRDLGAGDLAAAIDEFNGRASGASAVWIPS